MKHYTTHQIDQQGFVSIVVSLIIMVILSLVTIGFAQIMSREQRQALDRQLSTQAFYAAESGVNDARNVKLVGYDGTCGASARILDPAQAVRETCVFVNKKPKTIKYDNVGVGPKVFPVHTVDSKDTLVTPDEITIKWSKSATTSASDFRAVSKTLPDSANWQINTGMGRLYVIPYNTNDTRDTILQNTSYTLLNPVSGGAAAPVKLADIRGAGFGSITDGVCTLAPSSCSVTITNIAASTEMYIALSSLYRDNKYEISAKKDGAELMFKDVQAIVDSTGRTTDVLRRIEARVPLVDNSNYPVAALNGDVCKLWSVLPSPSVSAQTSPCP